MSWSSKHKNIYKSTYQVSGIKCGNFVIQIDHLPVPHGLRGPESLAGVELEAAEDEVAQLFVPDEAPDHLEAVHVHARLARVVLLEGRLAAALLQLVRDAAQGPHVHRRAGEELKLFEWVNF